jgi:uncharacterized membrane protein YphA (DoxX/SURF4 family)
MRVRDSIALTLPSLFLRLVLGVTFIWAGTGKLIGTMQVSGDAAARLANMGIDLDPIAPPQTPPAQDEPADDTPVNPLPDSDAAQPASPPETQPETQPTEDLEQQAKDIVEQIKQSVPATPPAQQPAATPPAQPETNSDEPSVEEKIGSLAAYTLTSVQHSVADRTGSDFPEPLECQRVYSIALMISKAADPGLTPDSQPITPTMPATLATGHWPKILAWSAAITELVAGAFLILGLLTRISALGTLSVMLVAMWMTEIGPAALHTNDAILGFIPNNQPWYDPASYSNLLWQLALVSMSLAVVFLGSGAIGLDRLFFSPHPRDPYLHGDPKATRTGRKPAMNPAAAQRSEFDRSPPQAS